VSGDGRDIEDHNVGLDMLWRDPHGRDLLKRPRQFLGMVMIMLEAGDMVLERMNAGGREDAGLPHSPAVHAAEAARTFNQLCVAGDQQGAGRGAETFREAEGHRFEMLRIGGGRQGGGGDGIEQSAPSRCIGIPCFVAMARIFSMVDSE